MLVAITDRRRFAIAPCDADIIQVREKDLDGGPLLALVRSIRGKVMVNDRVDVALAAGAYGVHLPERGMAIADVRALAPGLVIGASRHTIEGVRDCEADIIQFGPIWPSPGKGPALGLAMLERARMVTRATLIAVGGIETIEQARAAIAAGADGVAAIRAVWTGVLTGSQMRAP